MSERIDHAAKARASLAGSGDGRNFATDASVNAVAHATLALVEQQRIANIIAAGEHRDTVISALIRTEQPLRPEIAAALGLTAGQEGETA